MLKAISNKYKYRHLRGAIVSNGFENDIEFARYIELDPRTFKSRLLGETPFTIDEIRLISFALQEIAGEDERLEFQYLFEKYENTSNENESLKEA